MSLSPLAFAVLVASCVTVNLFADVTGAISGTVRDSSGGAIVNAQVVATQAETGFARTTVSENNGEFRLLALPPGQYTVTATAPGFQTFITKGINLQINDQLRIDASLQIGAVKEAVTVEANSVQASSICSACRQVSRRRTQALFSRIGRCRESFRAAMFRSMGSVKLPTRFW